MAEEERTEKTFGTLSMSPSDICFIPSAGSKDDVNHNTPTTLCPESLTGDNTHLHVVEKGGVYFTLDNSRLSDLKRLHKQGDCSSVTVEQVPLSRVPRELQDLLVPPIRQKGRLHGRGPLKLLSFLHLEKKSSLTGVSSTDDDSDEDTDRSDSECDWSADVK